MTREIEELLAILAAKKKLIAMVAPSYPVVFEKTDLLAKLRVLGFEKIMEVSAGAKKTNEQIRKILSEDKACRVITSPCSSFTRFVKTKHSELLPFLVEQVDSPMSASAKIAREMFPGFRPVFLGPCLAKKLEARENWPELNILVLTYKEILEVFQILKIDSRILVNQNEDFDIQEKSTRVFPLDGGLTETANLSDFLKPEEIRIVSGWKNCEQTMEEFKHNPQIRFVDALFCDGGCVMGPGIESRLSREERYQQIRNAI